jgi:hypothetical protein
VFLPYVTEQVSHIQKYVKIISIFMFSESRREDKCILTEG